MFQHTKQGAVTILSGDDVLADEFVEDAANTVLECMTNGQPRLVFNMEKIPLIDSEGLNFLIETRDMCATRGGAFKLASPNSLCRDILRITGTDSQLEVFKDSIQASGSFAQ